MSDLADLELRELLIRDPAAGWRAFVDQYTPTLLSLIERAGVSDHDEAMELYRRACERLSADDCARLRRHDPAEGSLGGWLSVVVRAVVVEWVRSRAGRRRLFHVVSTRPVFEQKVFELFYWDDRSPAEICEILSASTGHAVTLVQVVTALDAVDGVLTQRHRRELLALATRSRLTLGVEVERERGSTEPADSRPGPERSLHARELSRAFDAALAGLPPEDAAIARLKYGHGLAHRDIQRALHLDRLTDDRVTAIVSRLRALLTGSARSEPPGAGGLAFLDGGAE